MLHTTSRLGSVRHTDAACCLNKKHKQRARTLAALKRRAPRAHTRPPRKQGAKVLTREKQVLGLVLV